MKTNITVASLFLICLLIGCAPESKPVFSTSEVLIETKQLLESVGDLNASKVEYTDATSGALKNLEPMEGMGFMLTGTASLTFEKDHVKYIALAKLVPVEAYYQQWMQVVESYHMTQKEYDFFSELPDAYRTIYRAGETYEVKWMRPVSFYRNPETDRIDAEIGSFQFEGINLLTLNTWIPDNGIEVAYGKEVEVSKWLNQICSDLVEATEVEGRKLAVLRDAAIGL